MIDREILAQVRRIQVRTKRMVNDVMTGGYTSVFRGSGIEFDEVREYAEGDDIRAVDWNVTARTGKPHVKKYMEERELTVFFLLDLSASAGFGTSRREATAGEPRIRTVRETAAEFCACLALAAARNNDKAGLIAFTDQIERYVPAKKGNNHVLRLIREALALEPEHHGTDLVGALDYAGRVQRKKSVLFVISDFLATGFEQSLRRLARRHDVVAVRITDAGTWELPRAGLVHVRDPETGAVLWLDTSSRRVRKAHAERMAAWDESFGATLRRARVDGLDIRIRPGLKLGDPIMRFFRMRELRGSHG